jgi:hypothetical protein
LVVDCSPRTPSEDSKALRSIPSIPTVSSVVSLEQTASCSSSQLLSPQACCCNGRRHHSLPLPSSTPRSIMLLPLPQSLLRRSHSCPQFDRHYSSVTFPSAISVITTNQQLPTTPHFSVFLPCSSTSSVVPSA